MGMGGNMGMGGGSGMGGSGMNMPMGAGGGGMNLGGGGGLGGGNMNMAMGGGNMNMPMGGGNGMNISGGNGMNVGSDSMYWNDPNCKPQAWNPATGPPRPKPDEPWNKPGMGRPGGNNGWGDPSGSGSQKADDGTSIWAANAQEQVSSRVFHQLPDPPAVCVCVCWLAVMAFSVFLFRVLYVWM